MLSIARRLQRSHPCLHQQAAHQLRTDAAGSSSPARRRPKSRAATLKKAEDKSEWWAVDGEMHEIGENVPPRERFVIPRDNIPNKRRKQLREQFMRRTRLVLKESEHEPWCKRYMELYQELRENWERLYWDEGYSKKLAHDHANYDSAEDDDQDFSPYRSVYFSLFLFHETYLSSSPLYYINAVMTKFCSKFSYLSNDVSSLHWCNGPRLPCIMPMRR
ncbi:hypothetical protein ACSBR1_002041 [Camellia fascicularis]